MSDFSKLLERYSYKTREQQLDIIRLIYLAGGFDLGTLGRDLKEMGHSDSQIEAAIKVVAEATQNYQEPKDLQKFNAELVLEKLFFSVYPVTEKSTWPEKIHQWLLLTTQRDFFARAQGQERWQQETGQWMKRYEEEIKNIVKSLGLENEVLPKLRFYKAICPLGSTAPEMKKRLTFNKKILETSTKTEHLYPLTGERLAEKNMDNADHLINVSQRYNIPPEKIIETDLMRFAVEDMNFSVPHSIIHTPKGEKTRPTTVDTVIQLCKQVPELEGDVLFISGAPNIYGQLEDILATVKKHNPNIRAEVVGDKCEGVALNRIMGALGGALFGGYPRVAIEMGCQKSSEALEAERNNFSFSAQQAREQKKNTLTI